MTLTPDILQEHRVQYQSVDALVFEPPYATKVVISFTGMALGRYDRWSWFYERYKTNDNTLYICFKDDEHLFYLDRQSQGNVYFHHYDFILRMLNKFNLTVSDLYTVGSSMGGYAALHFAFTLGAKGSVVSNPLIDFESAMLHKYSLWTRQMSALQNKWIDLNSYISTIKSKPVILLSYGSYPADLSAANKIIKTFNSMNITLTLDQKPETEHADTLTKDQLFNTLDTWSIAC